MKIEFLTEDPDALRPKRVLPTLYRAWFEEGGFGDYTNFAEAQTAVSPLRGAAVRVDRIERSILWERDLLSREKEKK